jgi:glycosyltransferase involved in cell wall biosynthesis
MKHPPLTYVLITPAKNEDEFIESTIQAVAKQTRLPLKWVIVSDGSTDRTDEIAQRYASRCPWIDFVRLPEGAERTFAGKVGAFNAGYARVKDLSFDAVGSLDADITFPEDYFAYLLDRLAEDPRLGLAGTPFSEDGMVYDYRYSSVEHVSGACQLFRRECYEGIGGYVPVKGGGIDVIAVLSARMKGWRTRTFLDRASVHHRPMGSANQRNRVAASFKLGQRGYRLGFHPLWQLFRSVYQLTKPPYVTGGVALFLGYFWSMFRRAHRPVSREMIAFQQRDQMRRLREFVKSRVMGHKA